MNKREAKREAYIATAAMVQETMRNGWTATDRDDVSEADGEKIDAALLAVQGQLVRAAYRIRIDSPTPPATR